MTTVNAALGGEARVLEFIDREIAERGIGPGDRLPTERDLARDSGQSRTAVRRALQTLEADGRIIRHVGNYGEVFERNLGSGSPLAIPRGLNRLWRDGGIQYAPPIL